MNANCKLCGAPLKKGNIKVVRPRGKKRPYRVCRVCPPKALDFNVRCPGIIPPPVTVPTDGTAGTGRQRPQDTTGGPITVDLVFQSSPPPRFRYFMTQEQAERVKAAVERNAAFKMGVSFEVIPVPEDQVEADPESFADLVEVTVSWKVGE